MQNIDELVDVNSLKGIKDLLTGLKSTMLTLAEAKVTAAMGMKDQIDSLVKTAETMEIEKMFIKETEHVRKKNLETRKAAVEAMAEADRQIRKYL